MKTPRGARGCAQQRTRDASLPRLPFVLQDLTGKQDQWAEEKARPREKNELERGGMGFLGVKEVSARGGLEVSKCSFACESHVDGFDLLYARRVADDSYSVVDSAPHEYAQLTGIIYLQPHGPTHERYGMRIGVGHVYASPPRPPKTYIL